MLFYDIVIIGGGPAGLSAALVLGRCMRRALVCDSGRYRNERSQALHCYLGHDGIAPAELLEHSRRQLEHYETIERACRVVSAAAKDREGFVVHFEAGEAVRTRTLLVATGVVDELPQLEGIEPLFGH